MPFCDIQGHRRLLSLLMKSIESGRLPPSLIFAGPEGVGKRLAARAVAQALNCLSPSAGDGCGECHACRKIARGIHSDVQLVTPGETGSIKVDQIRDAIEPTNYRPFEGKRRVTVVDDADGLVAGAQNALLKTLEEPSASSVFILVTSRPDVLLPTVRSRCSIMRFGRLSAADVAGLLERDHKFSRRDAVAVAAAADGSMRRALDMQAGELADARSTAGELLRDLRGRNDARTRVERGKGLIVGGNAAAERAYLGVQLQALVSMVRDLGVLSTGADETLLANVDLRSELDGLAKSFDSQRALRVFAAVDRASGALERNVSPKVVADWLALHI
jgi:DNA polymerase III subunit delta'